MSKIRFDKLNDCIRALQKRSGKPGFTMRSFITECGTPACVIGHYAAAFPRRLVVWHWGILQEEFGVSRDQSYELFGTRGCGNARTRPQAIAYLRKFIRRHGGKVTA